MGQALLIVNPSSGGEKAPEFEKKALEKLNELFQEVIVKHTEKAGDATRFAKEAARSKVDSVFAMGGDGTVNEAISGLAEEEFRPSFGFFPLGTVNDLARSLGIPLDPEKAIQQLDLDRMTSLDIGKINDVYFMNVVAIGTLPEAINDVDVEDKTKFGKLAYFFSGVKNLMDHEAHTFDVQLDSQQQEIVSSTIIIGLTRSIGGFEQLLSEAEVNDGKLHFIYLKDATFIDTLKSIPTLIKGVQASDESVGYLTFKKGEITSEAKLGTNVDGDEGPELPLKLEVLPGHLKVYRGTLDD